jgi:hypothetical protein
MFRNGRNNCRLYGCSGERHAILAGFLEFFAIFRLRPFAIPIPVDLKACSEREPYSRAGRQLHCLTGCPPQPAWPLLLPRRDLCGLTAGLAEGRGLAEGHACLVCPGHGGCGAVTADGGWSLLCARLLPC